jgi:secreted Zn-dependent insulinase-like peptidase
MSFPCVKHSIASATISQIGRIPAARLCKQRRLGSIPDAVQDAKEQHEPWFDMPFASASIPPQLIATWSNPTPSTSLVLPPPNPFIPVNFDMIKSPQNTVPDQAQGLQGMSEVHLGFVSPSALGFHPAPAAVTAPECLVEAPGLRVLHKAVTAYGTPHAVALFRCDHNWKIVCYSQ